MRTRAENKVIVMNWKNELYNVIKFSGGNDKVGIADCIGSG